MILALLACALPDGWTTGPGVGAGPALELSEAPGCDRPSSRQQAAWDRVVLGEVPPLDEADLEGAGMVVADLDGDGTSDLLLPGPGGGLWLGRPEQAPEELPGALDGLDLSHAVGASTADVDGDGDLDVLVTRWDRPVVLLANDGGGRFVDVTARAGLVTPALRYTASAWGDLDGDGDLDLFLGTYGTRPGDQWRFDDPGLPASDDPAVLLENLGDGTFADISERLPEDVHASYTFQAGWYDVRGDGFPELFVWNDFGTAHPSLVLDNEGGELSFTPGVSGIDRGFEDMGVGVADLDHDGAPDFATTSYRKLGLLVSAGDRWVESAASRSLAPTFEQVYGWGAAFADLELDGDDDLVVGYGFWSAYPTDDDPRWQRDAVYLQRTDGSFGDAATELDAYEPYVTRGVVLADLDDDGYPDLAKRFLDAEPVVHLSRCGEGSWLRVGLRQPGANPFAVGARVTAVGGQARWIEAGSSSQFVGGPPEAHLGLGGADTVDIEVRWPDGEVSLVREVPTRRRVLIRR
ncbi:MAG: CRTAC1 family protein [Myxococcales bacterium]|nr:CRTAC1 family protein [Myxococcales bacterium]